MFKPQEHLIKLRRFEGGKEVLQDYLESKWRLVWFREEHPDWTIETEVTPYVKDGIPYASLARAIIKDEQGRVRATEWGYTEKETVEVDKRTGEKRTSYNPKFIEKSITTAIARALAQLGYGTQWAVEMEEGQEITEVTDAPVESNTSQQIEQVILDEDTKHQNGDIKAQNDTGATERQKKYIRYLLAKIGMTTEQYKEYLKSKYSVESSKELSPNQVSELIDYLKQLAEVQQ